LPRFDVSSRAAETLTVDYRSPRGLQDLAVGLFHGAAAHYGDALDVTFAAEDGGGQFTLTRIAK
jgi:hypothetical protein